MKKENMTLEETADALRIVGVDRRRAVRRLLGRYDIPFLRVNRNKVILTPDQFELLTRRMTCSPFENVAVSSIAAERSVAGRKQSSSKSTVQAVVSEMLRKPTRRS